MSTSGPARLGARLLGVIAPVLVITLSFWAIDRADVDSGPLSSNAKVLDHRIVTVPKVRAVVVGNSKVSTDLDLAALTRTLGLAPGELVDLGVHGTGASTWLSVLELRLYDKKITPELVIVYGSPRRMLQVAPEGSKEIGILDAQLKGGPEAKVAELRARIQGGRLSLWRGTASARRDALLTDVRNVVVGTIFDSGTDRVAQGAERAEASLAAVFPVGVAATRAAVGPIRAEPDTNTAVAPAESLAVDIARLASANGGQAVFIPAVVGPAFASQEVGSVAADVPALRSEVAAAGGVWVDLPYDLLPGSAYADGMHLRPAGRQRFTPMLVEALVAAGAPGRLHSTEPRAVQAPVPVERLGSATRTEISPLPMDRDLCPRRMAVGPWLPLAEDALAAAGVGGATPLVVYVDGARVPWTARHTDLGDQCAPGAQQRHGRMFVSGPVDAKIELGFESAAPLQSADGQKSWWVTPGTELRFDLPADAGDVVVEGRVAGPDGRVTAQRGDGVEVELTGQASARRAEVHGRGPLRIKSAPGGPAMVVDRVAVFDLAGTWYAVGGPNRGFAASVFGAVTGSPPPEVPGDPLPVVATRMPGRWSVDTTGRGLPSSSETEATAGARCSPMVLVADPPLGAGWTVNNQQPKVLLHAADPAATPPTQMRLAYAPERGCHRRNALWVYPGDQLTVTMDRPLAWPFQSWVSRFRMTGHAFGPAGTLSWTLRQGDRVIGTGEVAGDAWGAPIDAALSTPLAFPALDIALDLRLESGLLLLTAADVTTPTSTSAQ